MGLRGRSWTCVWNCARTCVRTTFTFLPASEAARSQCTSPKPRRQYAAVDDKERQRRRAQSACTPLGWRTRLGRQVREDLLLDVRAHGRTCAWIYVRADVLWPVWTYVRMDVHARGCAGTSKTCTRVDVQADGQAAARVLKQPSSGQRLTTK